jgi:DNA-binding phage protein
MKAEKLAPDNQMELFEIATHMKAASLPANFITQAVQTAIEFVGVYDLMKMWSAETDPKEQSEIVADIQDMIDDCAQTERAEAPYVKFNDLDEIAKNIRKFKDSLIVEVNQKGGLTKLSELTGIPQPSLSRFFNSGSMPRRLTLLKIAKALKLDAVKMATEWSR